MSYIPNIRQKYDNGRFGNCEGKKNVNSYWQGFLSDEGVQVLEVYDIVENIVENFFENLDVYREDIDEAIRDYEEETGKMATLSFTEKTENDVVKMGPFDKASRMVATTKNYATITARTVFVRAMFECMMHWMEINRDEIGVSILDGMPEDVYEKTVDKVLSGARKNEYTEIPVSNWRVDMLSEDDE